jgi:hypothetical protein
MLAVTNSGVYRRPADPPTMTTSVWPEGAADEAGDIMFEAAEGAIAGDITLLLYSESCFELPYDDDIESPMMTLPFTTVPRFPTLAWTVAVSAAMAVMTEMSCILCRVDVRGNRACELKK